MAVFHVNGTALHLYFTLVCRIRQLSDTVEPAVRPPRYKDHFIVAQTKLSHSISYLKNVFNMASLLIRPDLCGPLVTGSKGFHCNCNLINILDRWIWFSFEYFSTCRWNSVHHFWLLIENPSLSLYFQAGWTEKPITKPQFLADFDGSSRFGLSRVNHEVHVAICITKYYVGLLFLSENSKWRIHFI